MCIDIYVYVCMCIYTFFYAFRADLEYLPPIGPFPLLPSFGAWHEVWVNGSCNFTDGYVRNLGQRIWLELLYTASIGCCFFFGGVDGVHFPKVRP